MKMMRQKNRKGIAFTLDAILAILIIVALIPIFTLLSTKEDASQTASQYLHLESEDTIDVLSKMQIKYLRNEPVIDNLFTKGVLDDSDLNSTLLDVLGGLWASQNPNDLSDAANLSDHLISPLLPSGVKWSFKIENDLIFNTSAVNGTPLIASSKKSASGYAKNQSSVGYVARAFLENIVGKEDSSYFFFGGFVGEGNLTATIVDIPLNSSINRIYLEVNSESNFSMYLNNVICQSMSVSGGNFTVDNWTISANTSSISSFVFGGMNNFTFVFSHPNIVKHYFGGGYLKATYTTDQLVPGSSGIYRYYFPGIDGLLNLYDSVYVPGNLSSINAFIRLYSFYNYTTILNIGNTTV